jgi:hypothetical protein
MSSILRYFCSLPLLFNCFSNWNSKHSTDVYYRLEWVPPPVNYPTLLTTGSHNTSPIFFFYSLYFHFDLGFQKTANTISISSLSLSFHSPWLQTFTEMALKEEAPNSIVLSSLVPAVPLLHRDPDFAALTPPHETTLVSSSTFSISPKPKNEINKCVRVCICDNVALNYDYDAIMKLTICRWFVNSLIMTFCLT